MREVDPVLIKAIKQLQVVTDVRGMGWVTSPDLRKIMIIYILNYNITIIFQNISCSLF